jgi:hypothetical protein
MKTGLNTNVIVSQLLGWWKWFIRTNASLALFWTLRHGKKQALQGESAADTENGVLGMGIAGR